MSEDESEYLFIMLPDRASVYYTEFLPAEFARYGDAPTCNTCGRLIGMKRWLPPRRVELKRSAEFFGDFAFFASGDFLVSQRVRVAFEGADLRGLSGFDRVTVVGGSALRDDMPRYHYVEVKRSKASISFDRSSIEVADPVYPVCPECLCPGTIEAIGGLSLNEEGWSGEDVFIARGLSGVTFTSAAFRAMADHAGLTGLRFVRPEDFTTG